MPATVLSADSVRPDAHGPRVDRLFVPPRADPDAPPRVLIAEDHEDSRDALSTLLDALGYRVLLAGNGAEAVEVAQRELPDIILMDMMMPHVDGFEATRRLRGDPRFREVPIIAITAMEGARQGVLDAGCTDMVVKPIDIRAFLVRLQDWVPRARHPA